MKTTAWMVAALVIGCGGEESAFEAQPIDYQYTFPYDPTVTPQPIADHELACLMVKGSYFRHLVDCDGMTYEAAEEALPYFGCEDGAAVVGLYYFDCAGGVTCDQWYDRNYPDCDRVIMLPAGAP